MANTVSAQKMVRKIAKRTLINDSRRSRMRTFIRKVEDAITAGNSESAREALRLAEPVIMRASQKGVIDKTTASRRVSRLVQRVKKLSA